MDDRTFKSLTRLLSRLDNVKYNIRENDHSYWTKDGVVRLIGLIQDKVLDIIEGKPIPEEISLMSLLLEGEELDTCNTSSIGNTTASM